ncbi:glycosyltransferase family 2 protein [Bacteroidota bacterium]
MSVEANRIAHFDALSKEPLVSVLMPAYNTQDFISEAISSILNQTYQNWELLILDDGSTDRTLEIVQSFEDERIRVFTHDENLGYLLSCNELFPKASGDLITFLDADDISEAMRLELCVAEFVSNSSLGFLTTDHNRITETGKTLSENKVQVDYDRYANEPDYFPYLACASIIIRKPLLNVAGDYHTFFKSIGGEDYHWLFKLSQAATGKHLAKALYHYRQHKKQNQHLFNDPLKYFFTDINQQVRWAAKKNEPSPLESKALRSEWEQHIVHNQSDFYYRVASSYLNQGMTSAFVISSTKIILSAPLSLKTWKKYSYLMYSLISRLLK